MKLRVSFESPSATLPHGQQGVRDGLLSPLLENKARYTQGRRVLSIEYTQYAFPGFPAAHRHCDKAEFLVSEFQLGFWALRRAASYASEMLRMIQLMAFVLENDSIDLAPWYWSERKERRGHCQRPEILRSPHLPMVGKTYYAQP